MSFIKFFILSIITITLSPGVTGNELFSQEKLDNENRSNHHIEPAGSASQSDYNINAGERNKNEILLPPLNFAATRSQSNDALQ